MEFPATQLNLNADCKFGNQGRDRVLSEFFNNKVLMISICGWAIAQLLKVLVVLIQEKRVVWNYFITSGGMPSSHASTVTAMTTSIAIVYGLGSVGFCISSVLAVIVMYDAAGVRQSVGQQSVIINRIVKEIQFKSPKDRMEHDLREFIGHTPFQVAMGAALGIFIAWSWLTISPV
jgi:uncharacterized protein